MVSFFEYLVFFGGGFFGEELWMICRMDFDMFFGILVLDSKWGFWMGYSLCMMADFQNGLISLILIVFFERFLHRKTLNDLLYGFWHVFLAFIPSQNWFFYGSLPCKIPRLFLGKITFFIVVLHSFFNIFAQNCIFYSFFTCK